MEYIKDTDSNKTRDIVYMSVFTAMISICSWISIPASIPFTLQTMGVFTTVGLLGGKRGTLTVLTYILLGAIGIPVFLWIDWWRKCSSRYNGWLYYRLFIISIIDVGNRDNHG